MDVYCILNSTVFYSPDKSTELFSSVKFKMNCCNFGKCNWREVFINIKLIYENSYNLTS